METFNIPRGLILSDIDGTVTPNPPILTELAKKQEQSGTLRRGTTGIMGEITALRKSRELGYGDYADKLLCEYAKGLTGVELDLVLSQTRELLSSGPVRLFTNISEMLRAGQMIHDLWFVTASPQFIAQAVAEKFPGSRYLSTIFGLENGRFTGIVDNSLAYRDAKSRVINRLSTKYPKGVSIALGDSIGDVEMLRAARIAICVSPEGDLEKIAQTRGYRIVVGSV